MLFEYDKAELSDKAPGRACRRTPTGCGKWTSTQHHDRGSRRLARHERIQPGARRAAGGRGARLSGQSRRSGRPDQHREQGRRTAACREETEGCWAQNRRAHFVITAKYSATAQNPGRATYVAARVVSRRVTSRRSRPRSAPRPRADRRAGDRPADHQIRAARAPWLGRRHRALLIVGAARGAATANAGRHDHEVRAAGHPDRRGLLRRRHDAVEPAACASRSRGARPDRAAMPATPDRRERGARRGSSGR